MCEHGVAHRFGTVFLDENPRTPPSERFKLINHDVFGSPDGFVWNLLSAGHIPFSDTQTAAFYNPLAQRYSVYYRTHAAGPLAQRGGCPGGSAQPSRSIGLFVTDNLTAPSWGPGDQKTEKPNLVDTVFNVDTLDPPCMDFYTSAAVRVADATFIFPQQYLHCNPGRSTASASGLPISAPVPCADSQANDGLLEAGFAASRDGRAFERFDRAPFLPRGPGRPRTGCSTGGAPSLCPGVWEGAFDAGSTAMAVGIMDRGQEETLMIGAGYQYTHGGYINFTQPDGHPVLSGLQVLTMRRHGFVSRLPCSCISVGVEQLLAVAIAGQSPPGKAGLFRHAADAAFEAAELHGQRAAVARAQPADGAHWYCRRQCHPSVNRDEGSAINLARGRLGAPSCPVRELHE